MKTFLKLLLALFILLLVAVGGLVGAVLATEHRPAPVETVEVACQGDAAGLTAGQPFTVLSWNLQYGASRKHHFFYDGGEAVHVPPEDVAWTIDAISAALKAADPDLVLLQEVDRDSKRTGRKDQLPPLVQASGATCQAATPYHKSPFVPTPTGNFLGRVDMELATATRGPMLHASRLALPMLVEPRYRQVFNLKRAVLVTEVPVKGWDQPLAIANTHLSAFSRGDGTLEKQVAVLREWIEARPEGQPWIVAGDFNLLPPGFDKGLLKAQDDVYADDPNPIAQLYPKYTEVLGDQLAPEHRTYLPFGATEPDRKIDYFFVGGPLRVEAARVLAEHRDISDHLPVVATLVVGDPAGEPAAEPAGEPAATEVPTSPAQQLLERAEKAADDALKARE